MAFSIHNPTNFSSSLSSNDNLASTSSVTLSSNGSGRRKRVQKNFDLNRIQENENYLYQYETNLNKIYSSRDRQFQKISKDKKARKSSATEVSIKSRKCYNKSAESSEISSNNLTCSDLDTNSNASYSEFRMQRKKFIKCILREDINFMKNLLVQHDLTSIRDKHKNTLLHIACGFGRLKSVQTLMKLCPKLIELKDDKEHTPIDVAIKVSR